MKSQPFKVAGRSCCSYHWSEQHLHMLRHHAALLTFDTGRQDPDGGVTPPVEP